AAGVQKDASRGTDAGTEDMGVGTGLDAGGSAQELWEAGVGAGLGGVRSNRTGAATGAGAGAGSGGGTERVVEEVMVDGTPLVVPESEEDQLRLAIALSLRSATAHIEAEGAQAREGAVPGSWVNVEDWE
ncbi:unnamed protein product, partial [Discosporangium mesarthrocarpum]